MIDLTGKRAIVGGSTQGMGRATAELLARLGAEIVLIARREDALRAAAATLATSAGQQHRYLCQDYADPEALGERVSAHLAKHGDVHILVNNTGGPPGGPITDADAGQFRDAINRHVLCNQALAQAVIPGMKRVAACLVLSIAFAGCGGEGEGPAAAGEKPAATDAAAARQTPSGSAPAATQNATSEPVPGTMPIEGAAPADTSLPLVVVHKNANCGCCHLWVEHMQQAGFQRVGFISEPPPLAGVRAD